MMFGSFTQRPVRSGVCAFVIAFIGLMFEPGAKSAFAQTRSQVYGSDLEKQAMTVFVEADMAQTTYDSKTAESKESQQTPTYKLGGWVGENRNVGLIASTTESSVPFVLNNSSMRTAMKDIKMRARFGWISPTVAATLTEVKVVKAESTVVDLYGTGYGAGAEVQFPLHDRVVVAAEGMAFTTPSSFARNAEPIAPETSLGDRVEADVSASVDLTRRTLDLVVGYKVRNYSIIIDDETKKEKAQGAYVGLRLGLYF